MLISRPFRDPCGRKRPPRSGVGGGERGRFWAVVATMAGRSCGGAGSSSLAPRCGLEGAEGEGSPAGSPGLGGLEFLLEELSLREECCLL